jgi:AbiV family abortive infection protein
MGVEFRSIAIQRQGIIATLENAKVLFDSAELLRSNCIISPSISLLVLSSEELIKSFALCSEILVGDKARVKDFTVSDRKPNDSYLFNHIEKHNMIKIFLTNFLSFSPPLNLIKPFIKGKLKQLIDLMTITSEECKLVEKILNDLINFDSKKKNGLYVDFFENAWISPLTLNEIDYANTYSTTALIKSVFQRKVEFILSTPDDELELVYKTANELHQL